MFYSSTTRGFYDPAIHGDTIPEDATEIAPEEYAALIAGQAAGKFIQLGQDGRPVLMSPSASQLIANALARINARCEQEIAAISAGYPASEVLSWDKQESEARNLAISTNALTPLLDAMSAARGIDRAELANRVIAKADLFAQISGQIIGRRQALEDQVTALRDSLSPAELDAPASQAVIDALAAIQWEAA